MTLHARFKGNPNTNDAGRLFQINQARKRAGQQPLTLAEYQGEQPARKPKIDRKPRKIPYDSPSERRQQELFDKQG